MLRPFFCTQSLGPFVHPGAKLKGGCETKGGCKAATKPTLYTPMHKFLKAIKNYLGGAVQVQA